MDKTKDTRTEKQVLNDIISWIEGVGTRARWVIKEIKENELKKGEIIEHFKNVSLGSKAIVTEINRYRKKYKR